MYFFHREEDRVVEALGKSIKMLWEIWVTLVCTLKLLAASRGGRGFPVLRRRSTGSAVSPVFSNQQPALSSHLKSMGKCCAKKLMARLSLHTEWQMWKKLKKGGKPELGFIPVYIL